MGLISQDARTHLSVKPAVDLKNSSSDPNKRRIIIKIKAPKITNDDQNNTVTGNKHRDYIRDNLAKGLSQAAEEVGDGGYIVAELAEFIETNLYSAWGLCNGPKKADYRSLLYNLKDAKNPDFRKKVLCGIFSPKQISTLTNKDMASEARKLQDLKILDVLRAGGRL